MRVAYVTVVAIALLMLIGSTAWAGDWHKGTSGLVCRECHIMHGTQAHAYASETVYEPTSPPVAKLLRGDDVNETCLNCHDGDGDSAPDVFEAISGTTDQNRAAGALNDTTSTGTYEPTDGHTLGINANAPDGTTSPSYSTTSLQCTECHAEHGNAYYRNLKANPNGDGTSNGLTYDNNKDQATSIYEVTAHSGSYVVSRYSKDNVEYKEPTADPPYGAWCGECHGSIHSTAEVGGSWERHPTATANIGTDNSIDTYFKGNPDAVDAEPKVMDSDADWGRTSDYGTNITPTCASCHKGHGSANPFGLIYHKRDTALAAGSAGEQGASGAAVQDLCNFCHDQAGA